MGEEQGFLEALRADPHNEVTRLVYADWLEERGDPRHELMRWGEKRGMPSRADFARCLPDVLKIVDLARAELFWEGKPVLNLKGGSYKDTPAIRMTNGLVVAAGFSGKKWLRHGRDLVKRQPLVSAALKSLEPRAHAIPISPMGPRTVIYAWQAMSVEAYLYKRLVNGTRTKLDDKYGIKHYPTLTEALDDMSEAILSWCYNKDKA